MEEKRGLEFMKCYCNWFSFAQSQNANTLGVLRTKIIKHKFVSLFESQTILVHNIFQNFSGWLLVTFIFVLFQEIPEIVAFMKSDKFFKGPINNKMALIGST